MSALLRFDGVRIEAGGLTLATSLDVELIGPRSVVVGDARAILAVLGGMASVTAGVVSVLGRPLVDAHRDVRLAPLDPPLLGDLTAKAHLAWAARLAGVEHVEQRVATVAGLLGLGPWLHRALAATPLAVRRSVVLGAAAITEPALLVAEGPLDGLDPASAATVLGTLGRLVGSRAAIVTTQDEPIEGSPLATLAAGASDVVRLG